MQTLLYLYAIISGLTFITYARDKYAAIRGHERVPEWVLLVFTLAGGWLGAWLAQKTLRHKTQKTSFQILFWGAALTNVSVFATLITIYN